jgi:hypothetical protein
MAMSGDVRERGALWRAFKNVAVVFSFAINLVLLILLLALLMPGMQIALIARNTVLAPLVADLDAAFVGLGEATIETTVQIDESIPIGFELPLDEALPISFDLPIDQDTVVYLTESVPLHAPATFTFPGTGGAINGQVSLSLPAGMALPVHLSTTVPVVQQVPVQLSVPVSQSVPIQMDVPVEITLGESGLGPVVGDLRAALAPAKELVDQIPAESRWVR